MCYSIFKCPILTKYLTCVDGIESYVKFQNTQSSYKIPHN